MEIKIKIDNLNPGSLAFKPILPGTLPSGMLRTTDIPHGKQLGSKALTGVKAAVSQLLEVSNYWLSYCQESKEHFSLLH